MGRGDPVAAAGAPPAPAAGDGRGSERYHWVAILLRLACQLWLVAVVVRDVLRPASDPVTRPSVGSPGPVAPRAPGLS